MIPSPVDRLTSLRAKRSNPGAKIASAENMLPWIATALKRLAMTNASSGCGITLQHRRKIGVALGVLALLAMQAPKVATAAPQRLDCVLRDIETKSSGRKFDSEVGAENRALAVIFDDDAKTLLIKEGGVETPLKNIAISQTSMTAAGSNISLGIDRSSWYIVFQTYGKETIRSEFGDCSFGP